MCSFDSETLWCSTDGMMHENDEKNEYATIFYFEKEKQ